MAKLIQWLEARRDLCFEFLRIYLGIGLFVKGVLFASDPELLARMTSEGQLDAWAVMIAHYVVPAHLAGGAMLTAGLLTRLVALANVPILLGAVVFVHQGDGLFTRSQDLEFTLFVLFTLLLIVWHGPGRLALDHALFPREATPVRAPGAEESRHRIA